MAAGNSVTILGGGITGLTLGLLAVREGLRVTVADRYLRAGRRDGLMFAPATAQQELQYHHIWRWHGAEAVRAYAEQVRAGQELVTRLAAEAGVPVERRDQATVTADGMEAFWLRWEARGMRTAGLATDFDDEAGLPFGTRPALISADQPVVDPLRYRDALLEAFRAAGGLLVEDAPEGDWIVSTTPAPAFDRSLIRGRTQLTEWSWLELDYGTAPLPARNSFQIDAGGRILTAVGDRVFLGSRRDNGLGYAAMQLDPARVVSQWHAPAAASFDSLPLVGRSGPRTPRQLVATGFDCWELVLGTAAARQLLGVITGAQEVDALPWGPIRLPRVASVGRAAWGAVRHGLRVSPVTPFPKRG